MTISLYKGLTRNPEIGNTPVWVLPNIWRIGQVRQTKFGTNVSYKILQNFRVTAFTVFELLRENQQDGEVTHPALPPYLPLPRLGLRDNEVELK